MGELAYGGAFAKTPLESVGLETVGFAPAHAAVSTARKVEAARSLIGWLLGENARR
jgi:hypothetical protein